MSVTSAIGEALLSRTSRRGFLSRATVTATALTVAPVEYLLRPGSAYAFICECVPGTPCDCSTLCCDGYTQFCCTINSGVNACPPGTFAGGWWKADGSQYCAGARYYIDCNGTCDGCGCSGGSICSSCDGLTCQCAGGDCNNRHVGCTEFRYGQCHQEIGCAGRIACRVVSCTPPWQLDSTCSTVAHTDDNTANHFAPCQDGPMFTGPVIAGMAATPSGQGYWLVDHAGAVHHFGDARSFGSLAGKRLNQPIVGMAATPTGNGYWLAAADGGIFAFGDAPFDGSTGSIRLQKPIVGISSANPTGAPGSNPPSTTTTSTSTTTTTSTTATTSTTTPLTVPPTTTTTTAPPSPRPAFTAGYRMVASDGGVFDFDARFYGSTGRMRLNRPVVGMAQTPTGHGYWLVASDGGLFAFGDAGFHGSLGKVVLSKPIVGMAATPSGHGYWLVASDGGLFAFGDAGYYGSLGGETLPAPVVAMVPTPTGKGYWMAGQSGTVYVFGDAVSYGSLGTGA